LVMSAGVYTVYTISRCLSNDSNFVKLKILGSHVLLRLSLSLPHMQIICD